jgi:hypothetical protein
MNQDYPSVPCRGYGAREGSIISPPIMVRGFKENAVIRICEQSATRYGLSALCFRRRSR